MKVIFLYCMGCDIEYQKLTAGVQFDLPHLESGGALHSFSHIFLCLSAFSLPDGSMAPIYNSSSVTQPVFRADTRDSSAAITWGRMSPPTSTSIRSSPTCSSPRFSQTRTW